MNPVIADDLGKKVESVRNLDKAIKGRLERLQQINLTLSRAGFNGDRAMLEAERKVVESQIKSFRAIRGDLVDAEDARRSVLRLSTETIIQDNIVLMHDTYQRTLNAIREMRDAAANTVNVFLHMTPYRELPEEIQYINGEEVHTQHPEWIGDVKHDKSVQHARSKTIEAWFNPSNGQVQKFEKRTAASMAYVTGKMFESALTEYKRILDRNAKIGGPETVAFVRFCNAIGLWFKEVAVGYTSLVGDRLKRAHIVLTDKSRNNKEKVAGILAALIGEDNLILNSFVTGMGAVSLAHAAQTHLFPSISSWTTTVMDTLAKPGAYVLNKLNPMSYEVPARLDVVLVGSTLITTGLLYLKYLISEYLIPTSISNVVNHGWNNWVRPTLQKIPVAGRLFNADDEIETRHAMIASRKHFKSATQETGIRDFRITLPVLKINRDNLGTFANVRSIQNRTIVDNIVAFYNYFEYTNDLSKYMAVICDIVYAEKEFMRKDKISVDQALKDAMIANFENPSDQKTRDIPHVVQLYYVNAYNIYAYEYLIKYVYDMMDRIMSLAGSVFLPGTKFDTKFQSDQPRTASQRARAAERMATTGAASPSKVTFATKTPAKTPGTPGTPGGTPSSPGKQATIASEESFSEKWAARMEEIDEINEKIADGLRRLNNQIKHIKQYSDLFNVAINAYITRGSGEEVSKEYHDYFVDFKGRLTREIELAADDFKNLANSLAGDSVIRTKIVDVVNALMGLAGDFAVSEKTTKRILTTLKVFLNISFANNTLQVKMDNLIREYNNLTNFTNYTDIEKYAQSTSAISHGMFIVVDYINSTNFINDARYAPIANSLKHIATNLVYIGSVAINNDNPVIVKARYAHLLDFYMYCKYLKNYVSVLVSVMNADIFELRSAMQSEYYGIGKKASVKESALVKTFPGAPISSIATGTPSKQLKDLRGYLKEGKPAKGGGYDLPKNLASPLRPLQYSPTKGNRPATTGPILTYPHEPKDRTLQDDEEDMEPTPFKAPSRPASRAASVSPALPSITEEAKRPIATRPADLQSLQAKGTAAKAAGLSFFPRSPAKTAAFSSQQPPPTQTKSKEKRRERKTTTVSTPTKDQPSSSSQSAEEQTPPR
jgi:hypothetical protein